MSPPVVYLLACILACAQIRGGEGVVDRVLECPKTRLLFGRTNGGPLLRLYCSLRDSRPWSTVNFVPPLTWHVRRRLRAYADEIFAST